MIFMMMYSSPTYKRIALMSWFFLRKQTVQCSRCNLISKRMILMIWFFFSESKTYSLVQLPNM